MGTNCMPWLVGVTLMQSIMLVFLVTKMAVVVVRWQHQAVGSTPIVLRGAQEVQVTGMVPSSAANSQLYHEHVSSWPYTCWTPKEGMSEPRLTMVTVIDGLPRRYMRAIWQNRMQYAARHKYRYCELQMTDSHKIPAFSKLPWILALVPCTDFLIHVDADAIFFNLYLPLTPWINFMNARGVDQMFSDDCVIDSPMNYGVFMIRSTPWIYDFYRKVFNLCVCDWGRMNDWPAEQGIVYDLLARDLESNETKRSIIVRGDDGWNHILNDVSKKPTDSDILVHLTYPAFFPEGHSCHTKDTYSRKCKYIGLEYFISEVVGTKGHDRPGDNRYLASLFTKEQNSCQQVRQNTLFVSKVTYSNQDAKIAASVMDFDIDPASGFVMGIKVSEVGCLGYREMKCSLPQLWDKEKGIGPWMPFTKDIRNYNGSMDAFEQLYG